MRIPDDLDPADARIRSSLSDTLKVSRQARGITRRQVADLLGVTTQAVNGLEHRDTWEARTIMRYSRTIGHRIEWLLHDLAVPDDDDVMTVILAAGDTSTPERFDRVHWRTVCYNLVRARRAVCSAGQLAGRCAVSESAVLLWEANPDGSTVISAQRHARALGGALCWQLHGAPTPLLHHAPAPRQAA